MDIEETTVIKTIILTTLIFHTVSDFSKKFQIEILRVIN